MTDRDPLATALAAIREDIRPRPAEKTGTNWFRRTRVLYEVHTPRLLAAVEAARGFHASRETANGILVCPRCSREAGEAVRAPCPEIQAITRELTREGEHNGS